MCARVEKLELETTAKLFISILQLLSIGRWTRVSPAFKHIQFGVSISYRKGDKKIAFVCVVRHF